MLNITYIGVAMHGLFDRRLAVKYSYTPEGLDDNWRSSLPDPEAIVRNFISVRDCYVMWQNDNGHYFSLITADPLDASAGRVMLTLMLRRGCALTGANIYLALAALKNRLGSAPLTDEAVMQALESARIPETPYEPANWGLLERDTDKRPKPMAYRTFLSRQELESCFAFPNQPDYAGYTYIIVVPATSSLRPGIAVDRLTAPLRRTYAVICPEDVEAVPTLVSEGERVTLTFRKEDYAPHKEIVVAGQQSAYVRYEGSMMTVRRPHDIGIGFTRKVRLDVKSSKGGMINGYTVSVNDRPVNTMDPHVELTELDLQEGRKVVFKAASTNFRPLTLEVDPAELRRSNAVVELVLEPLEQGITLRLDFGEGRVFEQQISIERNTPEYSQLHSGTFHGFRAHRQTVRDSEVYVIDVRAAGKPVAPTFENAAKRPDQGDRQRVVPRFENVTDKAPQPEVVAADEPQTAEEEAPRRSPVKWIAAVIVGVLAIGAALWYYTGHTRPDNADEENVIAVRPQATTAHPNTIAAVTIPAAVPPTDSVAAAPAPAPAAAPTASTADIEYINNNRVLKRASLTSESALALYDALRAGDLDAVLSHPLLTTPGTITNRDLLNVADMLWAAKGSATETSNSVVLRRNVKEESVNLWDLYEAVAKVRPKEPNTTPRPGKPAAE